jgi:ribosomal protein S12 methylthiotransferase accessory factor
MQRPEVTPWYASPYTGLFRGCGPVPPRPLDPAVFAWAGTLPGWGPDGSDLAAGGAGWDAAEAEAAGVGEAVERWQCRPLPQDGVIEASFASWTLDEPTVDPACWVLFHRGQYARPGFPFAPLTPQSVCSWVCCREVLSGMPVWVPEGFVFLRPRKVQTWPFGPVISTGLAAGKVGDPVSLRGLQEVIERDALVGAWWGHYPLYEHPVEGVLATLPADRSRRLLRPNLRYRCYRVGTPFSAHTTVVTLEGEDREGWCFSVGSACRPSRTASWQKAFLEAVQGRHYVRYLLGLGAGRVEGPPADLAAHAAYYSLHPEQLVATVLHRPATADPDPGTTVEGMPELSARLGDDHAILFRDLTPPALVAEGLGWVVLRVIVPGLQPLHGHHSFPFLGGPLWGDRPPEDWTEVPPHPFP